MQITTPDYYPDFHCLAGACPHTCCEKWEVVLDDESVERYRRIPGALGEQLRRSMQADEDGDICFLLNGRRCPFLDCENLCVIHRKLGQDATSITCREHPRFTEDYGAFREITLSASCPEANRLLLSTQASLTFLTVETSEPTEEADPWLAELIPLRARMLALLRNREAPLPQRLSRFLAMAAAAQTALDAQLPFTNTDWTSLVPDGDGIFPAGLEFLAGLEALDSDWPELLRQAGTVPSTLQNENLLERIAVYFAFRYLLKAVNDGDLLSRAQLVVFAVLTVERLAAVCGLSEALRRFSCEVEHSEENLNALLDALRWDFSAEMLVKELENSCANQQE